MKNKILLIAPNLKGMEDGVNRIQPPPGLISIAGVLRNQGYDVKIYDSALEGWDNRQNIDKKNVLIGQSDKKIKDFINNYRPDIVGISVFFSNLIDSAHKMAKLSKSVKPNIPVVLGGNHISGIISDYEYAQKNPDSNLPKYLIDLEDKNIDFMMRGESEFTFSELVKKIINKESLYNIPSLVMRNKLGGYSINPPQKIDITKLPLPARDLVNMEGYFKIGAFHSAKSRSKRVLNIMASRGCPEKCSFCTSPEMWGRNVRWRPIESIVEEIKEGKEKYNIEEIQFDDDTITLNKKKLTELCKELEKIGISWCTPNGVKANYHLKSQYEMFKTMFDSGCYQITIGCESGVQRVLDNIIHKNLKVENIKPAIDNAKKAGMFVHTFWILGFPGETYEEIQKTVNFGIESGADSYSFAILNPLPGTPIYRKVVKENLWWKGKGLENLTFRNSLIKVDGFNSPKEFEKFIDETNIRCNKLLLEKDPERFKKKYGKDTTNKDLIKQT